ncbi:MAG: class I SAM-dependent methyltransferase [Myxococcaceae bacterium]
MRRIHFYESIDIPGCPQVIRDGITDWVRFMLNTHKAFDALAPRLREAMKRAGTSRILDLCSGGGGPWLTLEKALSKTGPVDVLLSDFYPNATGFKFTLESSRGNLRVHPTPVDAMNAPADLEGFRTIFNAFHHFPPEAAQEILADAVRNQRPIGVFEGTDSRLRGVLVMLFMPLVMWLCMPFVRPFRLSRLLLTYPLPVLPLLGFFDGSMSMLRTYSPEELRDMVSRIPGHESFDWDIGTQSIPGAPIGLTYLFGIPRDANSRAA